MTDLCARTRPDTMAEQQAAAVAAKSLRGRPRKLAEKISEKYDVWLKDDNPIETGQLQKLKKDINAFKRCIF